jgi:hypothetical protein
MVFESSKWKKTKILCRYMLENLKRTRLNSELNLLQIYTYFFNAIFFIAN